MRRLRYVNLDRMELDVRLNCEPLEEVDIVFNSWCRKWQWMEDATNRSGAQNE